MAALINVPQNKLHQVFQAVFAAGPVTVCTSESEYGAQTLEFSSADELSQHFNARLAAGSGFESYALHYADTGGYRQDRRLELPPDQSKGQGFRHSVSGWGMLHLKIKRADATRAICSVQVNSQQRARDWFAKYPELKDPSLWNWPAVEEHARRIERELRQAGKLSINPWKKRS